VPVAIAIAAASPPAFCQGLKGWFPDNYSSYEQYMQHRREEAEQTEQDGRLPEFMSNAGFGSLFAGVDHDYSKSLIRQAMAWETVDQFDKAERCYKIAVTVEKERFWLTSNMTRYASFLHYRNRCTEEKVWLLKVVQLEEEDYGADCPRRCYSMRTLAECYAALKDDANQIETLRRCLKIFKHARETNDKAYDYYDESRFAGSLARALEQRGNLAGAQASYKLSLSALKPGYAGIFAVLPCANELAQFYLRHGNAQSAEPILKRIFTLWQQDRHRDSSYYAKEGLSAYTRILSRSHRTAEAAKVNDELARIEKLARW
jgi:tetratricopeptide (TPR) repeat protein